nr:MAG TPA: hypothetical protein [Caudoviricetes sp.]
MFYFQRKKYIKIPQMLPTSEGSYPQTEGL